MFGKLTLTALALAVSAPAFAMTNNQSLILNLKS